MTTSPLLLAFPSFIEKETIEIDILRDLDRTLESLGSEPSPNTEETLKEWLHNHKNIKKQLREFVPSNNREVNNIQDQSKIGVGNVLQELRPVVIKKIEKIELEEIELEKIRKEIEKGK
jgi:hypothetical protein